MVLSARVDSFSEAKQAGATLCLSKPFDLAGIIDKIKKLIHSPLVVNVLSVVAIVFFVGFGKMLLSEKLILTLIAETVAQAAAIFITITRFLFPK